MPIVEGKSLDKLADDLTPKLEVNFDEPDHFDVFTTLRYTTGLYPSESHIPLLDAIDQRPLPESLFFLFHYHYEKLKTSGTYFGFDLTNFSENLLLSELTKVLEDKDRLNSYRIRVVLNKYGQLSFFCVELPPDNILVTHVPQTTLDLQNIIVNEPIALDEDSDLPTLFPSKKTLLSSMLPIFTNPITEPWIIHMAPTSVIPSPFTSFKTTHREIHNHFRSLFGLPIPGQAANANVHNEYTNTQDVLLYTNSNQVLETTIASIAVHRLIIHPTNGKREWGWITPPLLTGCQDASVRKWLLEEGVIQEGIVDLKSLKDGEIIIVMNAVSGIRLGQLKFGNWKLN